MNILVTGAQGFVGKNLVANLRNIAQGKNRTRPNLHIEEIFAYDDTVASVTATNSLDEEGDYAVTVITQEIIDGRAY